MLVFKVYEGLGDYCGTPKDKDLHPKGRLGARLEVWSNEKLIFESNNVSTLPDSVTDDYSKLFNSGSPIPIVCEGTYDLYTKYHRKIDDLNRCFELGKSAETVPVMRKKIISESSAINFHYTTAADNKAYASSVGCLIMLTSDLMYIIDKLGITYQELIENACIGVMCIDRSNINEGTYSYLAQHCSTGVENICAERYYKTLIQSHCNYDNPNDVWQFLDQHKYSKDAYKKWANSYDM